MIIYNRNIWYYYNSITIMPLMLNTYMLIASLQLMGYTTEMQQRKEQAVQVGRRIPAA